MRLKLIVQISLITGIVLLFTSLLFGYFNISTLKHAFRQTAVADLDHVPRSNPAKNDRAVLAAQFRASGLDPNPLGHGHSPPSNWPV